ncbi:hypothetical protein CXP39_00200 [Mesoplasma syrphidae]|uniref:HU family DNA-binding protein n=1 Tax=Mesoplasma syrphidae TaxID=225999 RepID=A0A2K9BIP6_9MOLU|nr:HU family DNA-binding protein [Mesoplasma syrphidae]AUF83231.1 hypothetical protein CXP39_00200 [Mesoplasma syrphidae]
MKLNFSKNYRWWMIFVLFFLIITLTIVFKIINHLYFGNPESINLFGDAFPNVLRENWFNSQSGAISYLTGPIGFKSFTQFDLNYNGLFIEPVFWDLLINWFFIIALVAWFAFFTKIIFFTKDEAKEELENQKAQGANIEINYIFNENKTSKIEKNNVLKLNATEVFEDTEKITKYKNETIFENKVVNKKHYQRVSTKYILNQLYDTFPNETKKTVNLVFEKTFKIFEKKLLNGEEITISNFGRLNFVRTDPCEKVNPLTGEPIFVPAKNTVKFKTSKQLRKKMTDASWTGKYKVKRKVEKTIVIEYND